MISRVGVSAVTLVVLECLVGCNKSNNIDVYSLEAAACESRPAHRRREVLSKALAPWKAREAELYRKWEEDEEGFHQLPSRAWPPYQPGAEECPALERALTACQSSSSSSSSGCKQQTFDLATCLVFNTLDPPRGLQLYRALSRAGHADGSVAAGLMLVEGLGVEADEAEGLRYLQLRESVASAQGAYELGTAIYTGMALSLTATATAAAKIDGGPSADRKDGPEERVVEDPDAEAFAFFAAAAAAGHVGGAFMTADMLFSGEAAGGAAGAAVGDAVGSGGTTLCTDADADADLQRAVALFAQAADKGHRSARMRMRALFKHSE